MLCGSLIIVFSDGFEHFYQEGTLYSPFAENRLKNHGLWPRVFNVPQLHELRLDLPRRIQGHIDYLGPLVATYESLNSSYLRAIMPFNVLTVLATSPVNFWRHIAEYFGLELGSARELTTEIQNHRRGADQHEVLVCCGVLSGVFRQVWLQMERRDEREDAEAEVLAEFGVTDSDFEMTDSDDGDDDDDEEEPERRVRPRIHSPEPVIVSDVDAEAEDSDDDEAEDVDVEALSGEEMDDEEIDALLA